MILNPTVFHEQNLLICMHAINALMRIAYFKQTKKHTLCEYKEHDLHDVWVGTREHALIGI